MGDFCLGFCLGMGSRQCWVQKEYILSRNSQGIVHEPIDIQQGYCAIFCTRSENMLAGSTSPDDFAQGSTERKGNMVLCKGM